MFESASVVEAAKDAFWRTGYRQTGIAELEKRTGLSRSSLYHSFGPKRAIFAAAVDQYLAERVDPLMEPMEAGTASPQGIDAFFSRLGQIFRRDPEWAGRGCLIMNAIAELSASLGEISAVAAAFPARLQRAFRRCLTGQAPTSTAARRRAELLATTTVGVWLLAPADRHRAARVCDAVRREVRLWAAEADPSGAD